MDISILTGKKGPLKRLNRRTLLLTALVVGAALVAFLTWGSSAEFPESWVIRVEVSKWINDGADWVIIHWDGFFDATKQPILFLLKASESTLLWLPWWVVVMATGVAAWLVVGRLTAVVAGGLLLLMGFLGLHDLAMMTFSIVLTATLIAVGFGLPTGIMMAKSNRFDSAIRPVLDAMQTMPSFVYLIPALMLFGLGRVPAVMATVIYAVPPMIRLTNLGIRQVDPQLVEAARAFGSSAAQVLVKVQLPMALPSIMAGVNQTIMMALAMVVIASMIGAKGLGIEVFNGIARLDIGRGFIGGLGIVLLAIIIDRISQGLAKSRRVSSG